MLFFDKTEQGYFSDFFTQHQHKVKTYCLPYESIDAFINKVRYDSFKYYYFFIRGFEGLLNVALSLCKSIYSSLTLSFNEAKSSLIDSANYLASWAAKHAFLLLTICLDLVQHMSKLFFVFCFLLVHITVSKPEINTDNINQQAIDKLYLARVTLNKKRCEMNEILRTKSEKSELLINYKNQLDPQSVPDNFLKRLNDVTDYYSKLYEEFRIAFANYSDHLNKNFDLETLEEYISEFEENHSILTQSTMSIIEYIDFMLKLHEEILSQSKLTIQLI